MKMIWRLALLWLATCVPCLAAQVALNPVADATLIGDPAGALLVLALACAGRLARPA